MSYGRLFVATPQSLRLSKEDREAIDFVKRKSEGLKAQRLAKEAQSMIPPDVGDLIRTNRKMRTASDDEIPGRSIADVKHRSIADVTGERFPSRGLSDVVDGYGRPHQNGNAPIDMGDYIRAKRRAA